MTLSEIVEAYNQTPSRDNTSKATKERVASKMNLLADIIGKNKVIRQITADDLQELVYTIPFIPSRFGSGKTANKTIQQAIKMAKVDETLPRLSVKTQNDYIQTLSSVFMWAKQKKFIDENPFDEVEMPAQDTLKFGCFYHWESNKNIKQRIIELYFYAIRCHCWKGM